MAYTHLDLDSLSLSADAPEASHITFKAGSGDIHLPDNAYVHDGTFHHDGADLVLSSPQGSITIEGYFTAQDTPDLIAPDGATLTPALVNSFAGSPLQYAANATATDESPVGTVSEFSGHATITHTDGQTENVTKDMPVFQGDVVETSADGAVNIHFSDDTSFAVSQDARIAIDEYVYDPATQSGEQNLSVLKGVFVFTSGLIGRDDPDHVNIATPTGSIGIRGTIIAGNAVSGEVTVVEGAIVVRDMAGNEMTLANQFETARIVPGQGVQNMGQITPEELTNKFSGLSGVAPTFFSSVSDSAAEQKSSAVPEGTEGESKSEENAKDAPTGEGREGEPKGDPAKDDAAAGEGPKGEGPKGEGPKEKGVEAGANDPKGEGERAPDMPSDKQEKMSANGTVDHNGDNRVDGTVANGPADRAAMMAASPHGPAPEGARPPAFMDMGAAQNELKMEGMGRAGMGAPVNGAAPMGDMPMTGPMGGYNPAAPAGAAMMGGQGPMAFNPAGPAVPAVGVGFGAAPMGGFGNAPSFGMPSGFVTPLGDFRPATAFGGYNNNGGPVNAMGGSFGPAMPMGAAGFGADFHSMNLVPGTYAGYNGGFSDGFSDGKFVTTAAGAYGTSTVYGGYNSAYAPAGDPYYGTYNNYAPAYDPYYNVYNNPPPPNTTGTIVTDTIPTYTGVHGSLIVENRQLHYNFASDFSNADAGDTLHYELMSGTLADLAALQTSGHISSYYFGSATGLLDIFFNNTFTDSFVDIDVQAKDNAGHASIGGFQLYSFTMDYAPVHMRDNGTALELRESNIAVDKFFAAAEGQHWSYAFDHEFYDNTPGTGVTYQLASTTVTTLDTLVGSGNWTFNGGVGGHGFLDINFAFGAITATSTFGIEIKATDSAGNTSGFHNYNFNIFDGPTVLGTTATISTGGGVYADTGATNNTWTLAINSSNALNKVFTGNGNDTITLTASGGNTINLGSGDDTITIGNNAYDSGNIIIGGEGKDTYISQNAYNKFYGGDGDDMIKINLGDTAFMTALNTSANTGIFMDGGASGFSAGADIHALNSNYEYWDDTSSYGDTLALQGSGSINFANIDNNYMRGIERIDATGAGVNATITLTYQDVIEMTDYKDTLIIRAGSGDTINFDAQSHGFTKINNVLTINDNYDGNTATNVNFDVYSDGSVTLLVQDTGATVTGLPP